MSWDVLLVKAENEANSEHGKEQESSPFVRSEVISTLKDKFPQITDCGEEWLDYEADTFAISFNLASSEQIMLHIHVFDEPEDAVMPILKEVCDLLNCRLFDTTTAGYITM